MGRAAAECLATEGCRVAVLARTASDLEVAAESLRARGAPDVLALPTDLLDAAQVQAAFHAVERRWGELNALVCSAGPESAGAFEELSDQDWVTAFEEGVLSAVRCVRAALPLLRKARFARIVTLAATSTRHQNPRLVAYTAAKAALVSVTKNLARSLAPEGVIVNCICPGWVLTPSIERHLRDAAARAGLPEDDLDAAYRAGARSYGSANDLGRVGKPEEVGALVAWLCSPLAAFTAGATIPVDGGTDFF